MGSLSRRPQGPRSPEGQTLFAVPCSVTARDCTHGISKRADLAERRRAREDRGVPRQLRDRGGQGPLGVWARSEEHTSELQSHHDLVCRLLLEKKKQKKKKNKIKKNNERKCKRTRT